MEGPLPSLNVSSGVSNGPQEPQPDGRQQARKSTVPRGVRFNASNESLGDGQMLYGGGNGGGQAPGTGTMSRVLSLRTAKSAGSLFNFNPEDPAELLATAADLPSMRDTLQLLTNQEAYRRGMQFPTRKVDLPCEISMASGCGPRPPRPPGD